MIFKKNKAPKVPKKVIVITLGAIFGVFAFLYIGFLFILPNVVNLNNYKPQIENELKKYVKFNFELINPKLSTTPDLAVKISADKITFKYSNGEPFAMLENSFIKVNLPALVFKELNLDKIYIKKASLLLIFDKNKKYTIQDYFIIQKNTNDKEQNEDTPLPLAIKNINIMVDEASFALRDENISKTFVLNAKENNIKLSSLEGPIKVKTKGYFGLEGKNKKFLDFNLDVQSPLPEFDEKIQSKKTEEFKLPNFNPFGEFEKFNFYANAEADLKISDITKDFKAKGNAKISGLTMLIKTVQLPESYINFEFNGNKITKDAKFYVAKNEFIETHSTINGGKKLKFNINANTEKISLNNVKILLASVFDMFAIENDLKNAQATGYLTCNFSLKSDGKNIKSSGNSEIKEGSFKYPAMSVNLTKIVSLLDFSNNKMTIKDTSAYLNGAKFDVKGEILTDSKLNININSDPIKIADIIKLGTSLKLLRANDIKDFSFTGGVIKIAVKLSGSLQNILPDALIKVDNTALTIKSLAMPVKIATLNITAKPQGKDFDGKIVANNLSAKLPNPKLNIKVPSVIIPFDSKTLTINKTAISADGSNTSLTGEIKNYMTKPEFVFNLNGKVSPATILQMVPKNNRKLVKSQGQMPLEAKISGNLDNIKVKGTITSNAQNYISIIDIESIKGLQNTLELDLLLAGNSLLLNDISLSSKGTKIAEIKGKISSIYKKNPIINSLSVSVPQKTNIAIAPLDNLKMGASANLNVAGTVNKPLITGSVLVSNLNYPSMGLKINDLKLNFKKAVIDAAATGISVAKSDFSGNAQVSSNFGKKIVVNSLDFNSNHFDSDALMKLASSLPNSQTAPGPNAGELQINKGKGSISNLKSGTLSIQNVNFDFTLKNNLFKMTNVSAVVYNGNAEGEIDYHLSQLRTNVNMKASNINVGSFSRALSGVALPMTGTASGIAKVTFKGATLKQQLQTLNGNTKFAVKNGEIKEFMRLENFLRAGNILSQNLLGFNLNSVISTISGKNTGSFNSLESTINFANGYANIQTFKTNGNNMSLNAKGKYNMLTNYADLRVLGRISNTIVNVLGPLGNYSVSQVLDNVAAQNSTVNTILTIAKSIAPANPLFQKASSEELAQIPQLSSGVSSKTFMVVIQGLSNKATSVKTFKWIDNQ